MKQRITLLKCLCYCILMPSLICLPAFITAQTIKRQCISSYGSSVLTGTVLFGQTAGQSYCTTPGYDNKTAVLHGFQQPVTFYIEDVDNTTLQNLKLEIYPNPATLSVTLQSDKEIEMCSIQVTDINGKLVHHENVDGLLNHKIHCGSWESGVYIIMVTDADKNSKSIKLIISK